MKPMMRKLLRNTEGAVLVEYTLLFPLFILTIFGAIQAGLLLWTQVGLHNGVDLAARCASVSDAAIKAGRDVTVQPTSCYNLNGNATANAARLKQYAASQSYGLNPPASSFTVNTAPAVGCGNLVSASYPFNLLGGSTVENVFYNFSLTITAQACYPLPS
jgi:Flp pilus assembly protein TadG